MGGGAVLTICLDKETYMAGELLTGHAAVVVTEVVKLRSICMTFIGKAKVSWSEGSGEDRKTYSGRENYFKENIFVLSTGGDSGLFVLDPGTHSFPYQFQLPSSIPPSYQFQNGSVKYYIQCNIDRLGKNIKCKHAYNVVSGFLDLNHVPRAAEPVQGRSSEMAWCLCCASGPISAHLLINKRGFVPGERIVVTVEVDNKSNRAVSYSQVSFLMNITQHAEGSNISYSQKISTLKKGNIPPGETEIYNSELLPVPQDALHSRAMDSCRIFDIAYTVKLNVSGGCAFHLRVPLGIQIGSLPIV